MIGRAEGAHLRSEALSTSWFGPERKLAADALMKIVIGTHVSTIAKSCTGYESGLQPKTIEMVSNLASLYVSFQICF